MPVTKPFVLVFLSSLLGLASWALPAHAQPFGKTVVVAYGDADLGSAWAATKEVERQLGGERVTLISMHDARDRFLGRSRPAQNPSRSDLDALQREAQQAVQDVALGRTAAAQRAVRQIIALAERSLESLNRETATARQLLDACLALVRASLHGGHREVALEQAMSCRRLVPDLAPSQSAHPANVVGVLAEADDQLRRNRIGSLQVRARDGRVCSVYLNGRHLGTTPFTLDQAPVGEYRVQVECAPDRVGRVHVVQLGEDPAELTVDSSFDDAVLTEPRLALRYADAGAARAQVVDHAQQIGQQVRADDVVLVTVKEQSATLLRVHARHKRLIAAVAVPYPAAHGFQDKALREALQTLGQARFVGFTPEDFAPQLAAQEKPAVATAHEASTLVRQAPAAPAPPPAAPALPAAEAKPLYKRWWLWTAVGVAVVAGVTVGVVLARRDEPSSREPTIDVDAQRAQGQALLAW